MSFLAALPAIAGGVSALTGIGNSIWNLFSQKKTWAREDNAVQRRVNDLKAAGLSPTLAAGSSASVSAPIRSPIEDLGQDMGNNMITALNVLKGQKDITKTQAEIDRINEEKRNLHLTGEYLANTLKARSDSAWIDSYSKKYNSQYLWDTLQARTEMWAEKLKGQKASNLLAQTNRELRSAQVDNSLQDLVLKKIAEKARTMGLDALEQDIIAKKLAIEITTAVREWNTSKGLPDNANLNMATSTWGPLAEILQQWLGVK